MYQQIYDPMGNMFLSTVVAAIPILTLLYFIALHRHRDAQGNVLLGISAPWAALYGVIAAFLVVCLVFKMPVASAISAFVLGSLSGFLGIIWIVLAAMFLYTMSVVTGKYRSTGACNACSLLFRSGRSSKARPASEHPWPLPGP